MIQDTANEKSYHLAYDLLSWIPLSIDRCLRNEEVYVVDRINRMLSQVFLVGISFLQ